MNQKSIFRCIKKVTKRCRATFIFMNDLLLKYGKHTADSKSGSSKGLAATPAPFLGLNCCREAAI